MVWLFSANPIGVRVSKTSWFGSSMLTLTPILRLRLGDGFS
jgi:hypothetical protein